MTLEEVVAALMEFPPLTEISVARVQPGDTIVIKSDRILSAETMERMKQHMQRIWPDSKVAVLAADLDLSIVREEKAADRCSKSLDGNHHWQDITNYGDSSPRYVCMECSETFGGNPVKTDPVP